MQLLPLDEEDTVLFSSQVNRTLYTVYRDNRDGFTLMWEKQGTGYWLKFCISLRSVLQKQGFSIQLSAFDSKHFEVFFIQLAKLLTGKSSEVVHAYVRDVVSISRFHQLLNNIPHVSMSRNTKLTPAFEKLFGCPLIRGNVMGMLETLPLHLHAVGCLLRLLERWLAAKVLSTDKPWWHPPESWRHGNQLQAGHFEVFLKKHWDKQLFSLLNVRATDICWWNAQPQGDRITKVQPRHTDLGCFIAAMCKDFDLPLPDCTGFLRNEMFYFHIIASCPRGKFRTYNAQPAYIMFISAFCRELYLVDSLAAFHPLSQVIISFSNAAFGHDFWFGGKGLQTQLYKWESEHERYPGSQIPPVLMSYTKGPVNLLLSFVCCHLVRARMALTLNSSFYDTHYGGVTWTSPATLVRLPWNIPLFTNWLEVLLIQIYEFERFFIPLCHFPLRSNVVPLVEQTYRKVSEAKFLVKTCIIVADGILRKKSRGPSHCHEARRLLTSAIPRLSHMMNFLKRDAYRVLDAILMAGWGKEEREDGECCSLVTDRIKVDLADWNSVPDINEYYSENFRHISYWITKADWPDIGGGEEFFTEALEMLKDYKLGSKTHQEMKDPYNFSLFKECAQSEKLKFISGCDGPTQSLLTFISAILNLLSEDGWLSPLTQEAFLPCFDMLYDINLIRNKLDSKSKVGPDDGLKHLTQMENFCAVYYITACLLGDTWQSKIAGQNAFAQLQRSESYAIMADSGARLSVLTQQVSLKIVECPPAQYFQDSAVEIQKHSKDNQLSVEEALLLLQSSEKEAKKKLDISTAEALTAVKVPLLEEMQVPSLGTNWLRYLENKRLQLLQLVSDEQFAVTRLYTKSNMPSSVELFSLHDILEHRFVEEMAAMQKCLELGGLFYGPAYGLCRLLALRFTWLQKSFLQWKKGIHKPEDVILDLDTKDLRLLAVDIRIRTLAAFIPLQALFFTYISKFRTTHPISEMTIEMFSEWTDLARLWSVDDAWNILGNCLRNYCRALKQMGYEYIEKMLDHCNEVWVVAPFCSNPGDSVEFGSIKHAQQIVTTFTQLFLMCYYTVLVHDTRIVTLDTAEKVEAVLVHVMMILRQVEIDEAAIDETWRNARQAVKKELRGLWSLLVEMRKVLDSTKHGLRFPKWRGNNLAIYKEIFVTFNSPHYRNVLQKIAFSEFINTKDLEPEGASSIEAQNEPIPKQNKGQTPVPDEPDIRLNGPNNSKTKINVSGKSNITEKSVSKCDMTESRGNGLASENKKHRKQHQNGETLNQNHHSENDVPKKYKVCTNCKSVEPERRLYKKCSLCKRENWRQPRFYCSKECQGKDWKIKHNDEHKVGEMLQ